ncbi:MAG: sigma-54-dependent Fis family transcriptional regulator [Rhodobacteraceae bacterium]|nr:sigma-54-dependent Fis family transcriptional regulator [Paracoccaceae bacterium]
MTGQILLVEDDRALRHSLAQTLDLADISVIQAGTYIEAKDHITADFEGVVLTDVRLPGKDGFDVLNLTKTRDTDLPVIVLTGEGDIPMAVQAMNDGAYDFLTKPCPPDTLVRVLKKALELRKLTLKTRNLERQLERGDIAAVNFPGPSPAVSTLRHALRQAAGLKVGVHLSGPEGSGKRIAAHSLHELTDNTGAFIPISSSDISPEVLLKATGDAAGGTLCLRWIDNASAVQQAQILALSDHPAGFRLVTTSNAPLSEHLAQGMQQELYYALSVMEIPVPALTDRREDLSLIYEAFARQAARAINRPMPVISPALRAEVSARDWQANLPELRNFAQRLALGLESPQQPDEKPGLSEQVEAFERGVLVETLGRTGGRAAVAANELGLPRKTFYDKLKRHGLKPEDFRRPSD